MNDDDTQPLVQALAVADRLPRAEIAAVIEHLAELTPDLLGAVERAANGLPENEAEVNLVFFALHILAVAREPGLHGPLMRLLRRPENELHTLFDSAIVESLGKMIAGAFDGTTDDLVALAGDSAGNEFLRSAVIGAIGFLTWDGRIDAAVTRGVLERMYRERWFQETDNTWFAYSQVVEQLGWSDLAPMVEQAYSEGRVWDQVSTVAQFRAGLAKTLREIAEGTHKFEMEGQGYLTDAIEELSLYHFEPPQPWSPPKPGASLKQPEAPLLHAERPPTRALEPVATERNPLRRVGRNDPCPCGSGKKYKKCCLAV
jgi:uncharacterized protein